MTSVALVRQRTASLSAERALEERIGSPPDPGTLTLASQRTQANDGARLAEAMKPREPVVTVGVRGLTSRVSIPWRAATACSHTVTRPSERNSQRRKRAKSGCGSIATTEAPSRDQERDRLPTWAPTSKQSPPRGTRPA